MSFFAPQPYPYQNEYASAQPPPVLEELRSQDITLEVRQQPRQALLTAPRKERNRKPVDPPVVVQMRVSRRADSTQLFLHNPNLFAVANIENEQGQTVPGPCLIGNITSSLHRLKEVDSNGAWGKDGGFFVFGDISVTKLGRFRFCFSIFELRKVEACALGSVQSKVFEVVSPKDYLGLEESSFLTRAFVDQGVRLRLRKEQRATGSTRARRDTKSAQEEEEHISPTSLVFKPDNSRQDRRTPPQEESPRPAKRPRTDLGTMYPGVSHSTRGWGAFNSADMHGWRGSGGETSMASFPSLSAEPDMALMSRLPGSGPTTQHGLQMPLPPSQLSSARTSVDWSNRQQYQSALAATGLSSPPSSGSGSYENPIPRPHFAHQSLQQVDASSPARSGQQPSPTYHHPPPQPGHTQSTPYTPTYARPLEGQHRPLTELPPHVYQPPQYSAYGGQREYHDRAPERQVTPANRSFGLQTLASASEQHAFIDPPGRPLSAALAGAQSHLGGVPIPISPTPHTYPVEQPIPAYSMSTSAGPAPDATQNPPQLQQAFRPEVGTSAPSYPFTGLP